MDERYLFFLNRALITGLILVTFCTACSTDNAPCDPACEALKLDDEMVGEGKTSLEERKSNISMLLTAYNEALPVCSGIQAEEIEARIDELKFEQQLVIALQSTFEVAYQELDVLKGASINIRAPLAQLGDVYE